MKLELEMPSGAVAPGQEVRGRVRTPDGGRVRAVTVSLSFREHGGSFGASAWSTAVTLSAEAELPAGWEASFALGLPVDARPGTRSDNGALWWQVEVRADVRGRDVTASAVVEVAGR